MRKLVKEVQNRVTELSDFKENVSKSYSGYIVVKVVVFVTQLCLFETPWTVAHQDPLSIGFSRQEY